MIDETDLFIFNLPNQMAGDTTELNELVQIDNMISEKGKSMLLVGEKELWADLGKIYNGISKFIWIRRLKNKDKMSNKK